MRDTINEALIDIATKCCTNICKHYQHYIDTKDTYVDPDEPYERLCIEHCEDCPLNQLGVWTI